jgi:hypothetical protein
MTSDEPSFFRAVIDGLRYTYTQDTVRQISTPKDLQEAAIVEILKLHAQNKDTQGNGPVDNEEQPLLVKEKRVKEKRPQTKGGYVKNTEVVNPYHKNHHSPIEEYQAASRIIGHTILVYTKNNKGHLQQANKFTPQDPPRGSPIVLVESKGVYTLDVQRTKHWSFYGAVSSYFPSLYIQSITAEQLYDQVGYKTRLRLDQTPRVELLKNQLEYLEHHASAIPPAINPHELQTLADMLKRPIRTNPIMSMGYGDRKEIHMTPTGWTGSNNIRDLVVLFEGNHYRTPKMAQNKGRSRQNMLPVKKELSGKVETVIDMLPQIDLLVMENQQEDRPNNNERVVPLYEQQNQQNQLASLREQAHDIKAEVESIQSPADARRADVSVHDLERKTAEYITEHHPEYLPIAIEQAKASPGLFRKLMKHTGSAVRASGRSAKGVVDRSSLGDFGVSGIAIVSGLSVLSSYTSVWRVFFG